MLLKGKSGGTIKGKSFSYEIKQCKIIDKNNMASQIVCTESVFIIEEITVQNKCDTDTINIPGAYLQAENYEGLLMFMQVPL